MESTFIISKDELDSNFLASLKKLFKNQKQLQISISIPEDFDLNQNETPKEYLKRLEYCLKEVKSNKNTISFSESELDNIIIENL